MIIGTDRVTGGAVTTPLELDGDHGEGGGQIVRTALALAVAGRRALHLVRIQVRRRRPGLQPQHLTVVRALAAVSAADVEGELAAGHRGRERVRAVVRLNRACESQRRVVPVLRAGKLFSHGGLRCKLRTS